MLQEHACAVHAAAQRGERSDDSLFDKQVLHLLRGHEGIVQLDHVGCDSANLYCVMEYLPTSLASRVQQAEMLDEDEARYYVQDILCGLEALHALRMAHMDLTPFNGMCVHGLYVDLVVFV